MMTNEQKHEMVRATQAALTAASVAHKIAREACGMPDNCCQTERGWMVWDDASPSNYCHSTAAEGIEVALDRLEAAQK